MLLGAGLGGGANNNNIQYGFESSCPEGINQNTALLATAAAIGKMLEDYFEKEVFFMVIISAVGAGVIFRAVTQQQGRRKKRGARDEISEDSSEDMIVGWLKTLYKSQKKYLY